MRKWWFATGAIYFLRMSFTKVEGGSVSEEGGSVSEVKQERWDISL